MSESLIDASLYVNFGNETSESHDKNTKKLPVYEKISETEDIYIIHTKDHSYELHRTRLIDTLKELHKYAHIQITQLDEKQSKLLASTIETTRLLYNTKALKDLVLKDIQHIYSHIKNPVPGTVASFFIGCFNLDEFTGPLGCNPRCAASLLKCEGVSFECGDTILIFSNHDFTSVNKKMTTHAYIYIEDENFKEFSKHEYNRLNDAGIKSVTLIYGNADGSYREITNEIFLNHSNTTDATNIGWIILIIVIILLIIIALMFFYGREYLY